MRTELRWRSGIPWVATAFLTGVILLGVMGLPSMRGSNILASYASPAANPGAAAAWRMHIRRMDAALGQGAIQAAEANWLVAHLEATRTPTWEGWIGVGDAALRLGEATGLRTAHVLRARQAYQKAVRLASDQKSEAGVVAAADAFAALGDTSAAGDLRAFAGKLALRRTE